MGERKGAIGQQEDDGNLGAGSAGVVGITFEGAEDFEFHPLFALLGVDDECIPFTPKPGIDVGDALPLGVCCPPEIALK